MRLITFDCIVELRENTNGIRVLVWQSLRFQSGGGHRGCESEESQGMGVPVSQMWTVASYVLKQRVRGASAIRWC